MNARERQVRDAILAARVSYEIYRLEENNMPGFLESHYWLFTGRDWDQDRENFKCNSGFCSTITSAETRLRARPERNGQLARAVIIGALL